MKSLKNILMMSILALSVTSAFGQIKNATTETVKIYGNCGMCEKTIENAGNSKKVASVDWNKETKMATLIFDATKTSKDELLKKIALAGYDSDSFLAPDEVFNNLHGCCQYDREAKIPVEESATNPSRDEVSEVTEVVVSDENWVELGPMEAIFETYFDLKNALVKSDAKLTSEVAKRLMNVINVVKMLDLKNDVHTVWMKVSNDLKSNTDKIAKANDIEKQRMHFITLSENMYQLIKVSKMETPVYLQHCPMANDGGGANWLSKENTVKNPYYGSKMMSCGKTVEIIK